MLRSLTVVLCIVLASASTFAREVDSRWNVERNHKNYGLAYVDMAIELGPRPMFLINDMAEGPLKSRMMYCAKRPNGKSSFSIGHRGAPLQFPEHTKESYLAAAKMGAGILECDVTFTKDKELVCRHSQCDLHRTTNILTTPLAQKCSQAFQPAQFNEMGELIQPASARCCTTDITLQEFKSLQGKMDSANTRATDIDSYLSATADWRTDLYSSKGTLLSHAESIELFQSLGVKMTPELKAPEVEMPYEGMSQQDFAQMLIHEYKRAGIPPRDVLPQSFQYQDILYWIENERRFGLQAVYLDGRYDLAGFDHRDPSTWIPSMHDLVDQGVNIIAPPVWMLVEIIDGKIAPSEYAIQAKAAGLDILTWTLERSGHLREGGGWYYQTLNGENTLVEGESVISQEGDVMELLHVLAMDIGVLGVFSDWPATVTYYANCMKLR